MRSVYVLIALTLLSSCNQPRPTRPSFGKGAADVIPGGGVTPDTLGGGGSTGGIGKGGSGGGGTTGPNLTINVVDSRETMRISSVEVLINKLKIVASIDDNSEAIKLAIKTTQSLGSYNFAQGVLPENKWTLDKMGTWFKVVDQACREEKLLDRIQKTGGDKDFIETALGRDIVSDETAMLKELDSKKLSGPRRARVLCTAILTSGEFVSL